MYVYTSSMLPFKTVPIIFEVLLLFQHIMEETLKASIKEPDSYMRIINKILLTLFSASRPLSWISIIWH